MTNLITAEFQLAELARSYAEDIVTECKDEALFGGVHPVKVLEDKADELAWQCADGSEHVIYHHKALQICSHCDTDRGEEHVECMGIAYTNINELASAIVFGEIYSRIMEEVHNAMDALAECDELEAEEV
jgi:hypothetical protein